MASLSCPLTGYSRPKWLQHNRSACVIEPSEAVTVTYAAVSSQYSVPIWSWSGINVLHLVLPLNVSSHMTQASDYWKLKITSARPGEHISASCVANSALAAWRGQNTTKALPPLIMTKLILKSKSLTFTSYQHLDMCKFLPRRLNGPFNLLGSSLTLRKTSLKFHHQRKGPSIK